MKIFKVVTEHYDDCELMRETQFVTSDSDTLKSVSDHFTTHCFEYGKDLKSVREILTVTENLARQGITSQGEIMEVVSFYPMPIEEIADQDNPVTGSMECLMITGLKMKKGADFIAAEVYHIKPGTIEPADSVGIFWKLEGAQEYCNFLAR